MSSTEPSPPHPEVARLRRQNHALTLRLARALEDERKQLARELHDELGQSLTAIKTDAVLISNLSQHSNAQNYRSAQAILNTVSRIYEVVYSMMRRLRPSVFDELGLGPALEALINEWRQRHPYIPCELAVTPDLDQLDDLIGITVYRTVQESLTNIVRYSAASHATVSVAWEAAVGAKGLRVVIEDNGRGLDSATPSAVGGFGLRGLRERIEALGGQLTLASTPECGTKVSVWLPVTAPASDMIDA